MFSLIIDNRERALFSHIEKNIKSFHYEKMQLSTGDYLIIETDKKIDQTDKKIRACIERKTYKDLASSFRDGRYKSELSNMINMRNETNCQLFFIIEGTAFPSIKSKFSRVPYACILGAINKLMIRDNVFIIQTKNEEHTSQKLNELLNTMQILYNEEYTLTKQLNGKIGGETNLNDNGDKDGQDEDVQDDDVQDEDTQDEDVQDEDVQGKKESTQISFKAKLTKRHILSDKDICLKAWSTLTGISLEFSNTLIHSFSIKDLITKQVSIETLNGLKSPLGKKINKIALSSLLQVRTGFHCEKMLSSIVGITIPFATLLLKEHPIENIISMEKNEMKNILVNQKKLGIKKTENIRKLLEFKL